MLNLLIHHFGKQFKNKQKQLTAGEKQVHA